MNFIYDDGGRSAAGYKGFTGDCACRAAAIATQRPYQEIYDLINELAKSERTGKRKHKKSNARTGVYQNTFIKVMSHYGFKWIATMRIGQGCTTHLRSEELPPRSYRCQSFPPLRGDYRRRFTRYIQLHSRRLALCLRILYQGGLKNGF